MVGGLDGGLGLGVACELAEDLAHVLLGLCEGGLGLLRGFVSMKSR